MKKLSYCNRDVVQQITFDNEADLAGRPDSRVILNFASAVFLSSKFATLDIWDESIVKS